MPLALLSDKLGVELKRRKELTAAAAAAAAAATSGAERKVASARGGLPRPRTCESSAAALS